MKVIILVSLKYSDTDLKIFGEIYPFSILAFNIFLLRCITHFVYGLIGLVFFSRFR